MAKVCNPSKTPEKPLIDDEKSLWQVPTLEVIDLSQTEGGSLGLFEDESGIASS